MPAVAPGSGAIYATRLRLSADACLRRKLGDWAGAWAEGARGVRAGGGWGARERGEGCVRLPPPGLEPGSLG